MPVKKLFPLFAALLILLFLIPVNVKAEEAEEDMTEELIRQLDFIDSESWEIFFRESGIPTLTDLETVDELLLAIAEGRADDPQNLMGAIKAIAQNELTGLLRVLIALAVAAALTMLPALITDEGIKPVLSLALSLTAVMLSASAFTALCGRTFAAVKRASEFTESSIPVMCGLLLSMGSTATAGVLRPLMLFLSGTVIGLIERVALPVCAACGVFAAVNCLTEDGKLTGWIRLAGTIVRSLLGVLSVVYIGVTGVRGMTMGLKDGVAIRTARYAIGRMVPIVGSMVSGTVESIMGCALLLKNGVGAAAALLLVSVMAAPIAANLAAIIVFRAAAAFAGAFADKRIAALYSGIADSIKNLLACSVAAASMLAMTIAVFLVSGGMTAGLW